MKRREGKRRVEKRREGKTKPGKKRREEKRREEKRREEKGGFVVNDKIKKKRREANRVSRTHPVDEYPSTDTSVGNGELIRKSGRLLHSPSMSILVPALVLGMVISLNQMR
jgi:hypothetical protein